MTDLPRDTRRFERYLFDAVLVDTNVLRAAGLRLASAHLNPVLDLCQQLNVEVIIAELSLQEWAKHLVSETTGRIQAIKQAAEYISATTGVEISLPPFPRLDRAEIQAVARRLLEERGIRAIPTRPKAIETYLQEAGDGVYPFQSGGKGMADAVILDSAIDYVRHLTESPYILVMSADAAVRLSHRRFTDAGVRVVLSEPKDTADELRRSMTAAQADLVSERQEQLLAYVQAFEPQILAHLKAHPVPIGNYSLHSVLEEEGAGTARIERILDVRPRQVVDASIYFHHPEEVAGKGRYRLTVYVESEIDLLLSEIGPGLGSLFDSTEVRIADLSAKGGIPLAKSTSWKRSEFQRTGKLSVTVDGSVDRFAYDAGTLSGFRIEQEYTGEQLKRLVELLEADRSAEQDLGAIDKG